MNVAVTYLLTTTVTLLVLFSIGKSLVTTFEQITDSWTVRQDRWEREADTKIAAPPGQWAVEEPTVKITVSNTGKVQFGRFADWDVIFEIQQNPGLGIAYLTYTSTPLGTNEWTVDGIYRDAATLAAETVDPGILNPGEEMVLEAKPAPPVVLNTFDRAIVSTPSGVAAEVVFEIK